MSPKIGKRPTTGDILARQADDIDTRYHPAAALRRQLNKVFPTHWSFLLGEIALYSFVVLLITGVYLTLFFDPSMNEVVYNGTYQPLRGVQMSRAYETMQRQMRRTAEVYNTEVDFFPDMGHGMILETGWQAVAERILSWLNTTFSGSPPTT